METIQSILRAARHKLTPCRWHGPPLIQLSIGNEGLTAKLECSAAMNHNPTLPSIFVGPVKNPTDMHSAAIDLLEEAIPLWNAQIKEEIERGKQEESQREDGVGPEV